MVGGVPAAGVAVPVPRVCAAVKTMKVSVEEAVAAPNEQRNECESIGGAEKVQNICPGWFECEADGIRVVQVWKCTLYASLV